MESKEIISGSKLIAEFLGFVYIPFSADLKELKPGWYETKSAEPNIKNTVVGDIDINLLLYHNKNGWKLFEGKYYRFICRNHGELRFWNSLDALVPVIQKIEKEGGIIELHSNGCVLIKGDFKDVSFNLPNWSNNVFKVIVEYLKTK